MRQLSALSRRLFPLYMTALCQGIVFWYATEKLFMTSIGFNDATIGVMIAAYSTVMLLVETPAGILADRWSRKNVLILASIALGVSGVVGGFSTSVATFVVSALFWGVFAAFSSGTYDSIIYDVLQEEEGSSKRYELFYGRHKVIEGLAFVVGALCGGVLAQYAGLRATFFYSLPFIILSVIFLSFFKEPTIHKLHAATSIKVHITQTLVAVLRKRTLVLILIGMIVLDVVVNMLLEFNQLWLIAIATPVILYGPADAILLSSWSLGGLLAKYIKSYYRIFVICCLMLGAIAVLSYSHLIIIVVLAQFILAIGIVSVTILLTHQLHDQLPSQVRVGAASVVSTMARLVVIPFALIFGIIANSKSIFTANILLIVLLLVGIAAIVWSERTKAKRVHMSRALS